MFAFDLDTIDALRAVDLEFYLREHHVCSCVYF